MRLAEAAQAASERGFERFSTSLTVSPWQHHDLIARAGYAAAEAAGVEFVYADLRRWYPRSIDESKRLELTVRPTAAVSPADGRSGTNAGATRGPRPTHGVRRPASLSAGTRLP